MENNVVSLETAKKLKAAGFPQTMAFGWQDGGTEPLIGYWEFAAPTAQEIADQLPKPIAINIYSSGRVSVSHAGEDAILLNLVRKEIGMTEALALLWLSLHEKTAAQDGTAVK